MTETLDNFDNFFPSSPSATSLFNLDQYFGDFGNENIILENLASAEETNTSPPLFSENEIPDLSTLEFDVIPLVPESSHSPNYPLITKYKPEYKPKLEETKKRMTSNSSKKARIEKEPISCALSSPKIKIDDKYKKRLEANKKSAQASRERKKKSQI